MFRSLSGIVIVLVVGSWVHANHVDFIQDDSNTANGTNNATFSRTSSGSAVSDTQVGDPADILGGTRTVTVIRNGGFGGTLIAEKTIGSSVIDVQGSTLAAGTVTLDYNGFDNEDFDTMWDRIDVAITNLRNSPGDGEIDLFLTVESSAGSGTVQSARQEASINPNPTISFDFTNPGFAGVDFKDVDRIVLDVRTAIIGTDFQIASITREVTAVPEPSSFAALGILGCTGCIIARRRRRRVVCSGMHLGAFRGQCISDRTSGTCPC